MKSADKKPEPGGEKKKIRAPEKKPASKKPAVKKTATKKPAVKAKPKKPAENAEPEKPKPKESAKKPAAKPAAKKKAVKKTAKKSVKRPADSRKVIRTRQTIENVTTEKNLTLIRGWCMDGATNAEIAAMLKISETTFYRYVQKSEKLREALAETREVVDRKVENALLKRALGCRLVEEKYITVPMELAEYTEQLERYMNLYRNNHPDATDDELMLVELAFPRVKEQLAEKRVKEVPPDVGAQIFWLKNRKPKDWRQKVEDFQDEDDGTGLLMMPAVVEEEMDPEDGEAEG